MITINLLGSFFEIKEEGYADWRDKIKEKAPNNNYLDPLDNDQFSIKTFTEQDLDNIHLSDFLFVYFSKQHSRGHGTSGEMGGGRITHKKIILVDEKKVLYPFLIGLSSYILTDFDLAINCLKQMNKKEDFEKILLEEHKKLITNNNQPATETFYVNGVVYALTRILERESSSMTEKQVEDYFKNHIPHILLDENKVLNTNICHMSKRIFTNKDALNFYLDKIQETGEFKATYTTMKEFPN